MPNRPKSNSGQLADLLRARVADGDWTIALPHLLHRGLRIPQDLSMVYLSNDPAVDRLSPLPDRYDIGDRLLRRLAKAAQDRLSGVHPASSVLLPCLVKGETLA